MIEKPEKIDRSPASTKSIDLKTLSVEALKAMGYDHLVRLGKIQLILHKINSEIERRSGI